MLNQTELKTLMYIYNQINEAGYPPTVRQIAKMAGYASSDGGHRVIHSLIEKGYLLNNPKEARTLTLTAKANSMLFEQDMNKLDSAIKTLRKEAVTTDRIELKENLILAVKCMEEMRRKGICLAALSE